MSEERERRRIRAAYARRRKHDPRYSYLDPAYLFLAQQRERLVLRLLNEHSPAPISRLRILEVGCGEGRWLRDLVRWGARPANLCGVELIPERARAARRLCAPGTRIRRADASHLPFPDGSFDVVLQSTVFTSILDPGFKRLVASEMMRVLAPRGLILWYDYFLDNPSNPDVRGVGAREISALFPGWDILLRRTTLLPPLSRVLIPLLGETACSALACVPFLCSHYLGVIRRPSRP